MNNVTRFPDDLVDYFPRIFDALQPESQSLADVLDPERSIEDVARAQLKGDFDRHGPAMMEIIEELRHKASIIPPLFDKAYMHVYSELPNRRFFDETTSEELRRLTRGESEGSSVILMDVDKLHALNERYDYATGDKFLKTAATNLKAAATRIREQIMGHEDIPDNNVIAHFGGDEFAILITNESDETAQRIATHLKDCLEGMTFTAPDGAEIPIGMSMGTVHARKGEEFSDIMKRANTALHTDKEVRAPIRDQLEADLSN